MTKNNSKAKSNIKEQRKLLKTLYYDLKSPAAYSTPKILLEEAKKEDRSVTMKFVEKWMSAQDVYTINRRQRKRFPRRKIITKGIDYLHQIDLLDVSKLAPYNGNVRYLLTMIDCFSRFAMVSPVKRKLGTHVAAAIENTYKTIGRLPMKAQSDQGGEFLSPEVKAVWRKYRIKWYYVSSSTKAPIVERFNRFFRRLLMKSVFGQSRPRYLELLPDIVNYYNSKIHRVLGVSPNEVNKKNETELWFKQYGDYLSKRAIFKYELGDIVRITRKKTLFEKEVEPNWSERLYQVVYRRSTKPVTYKLSKPPNGTLLPGSYYEYQIQKIWINNDDGI